MHSVIKIVDQSKQLYEIKNPISKSQIIDLALELQYKGLRDRVTMSNPFETKKYFQLRLAGMDNEVFSVMFLSSKNQVINCIDMFEGTIDSCCVYVRQVMEEVLIQNASSVIVAHNHPSGNSEPSIEDKTLTQNLQKALDVISVRLLDHIIVGDGEAISFAETKQLEI